MNFTVFEQSFLVSEGFNRRPREKIIFSCLFYLILWCVVFSSLLAFSWFINFENDTGPTVKPNISLKNLSWLSSVRPTALTFLQILKYRWNHYFEIVFSLIIPFLESTLGSNQWLLQRARVSSSRYLKSFSWDFNKDLNINFEQDCVPESF